MIEVLKIEDFVINQIFRPYMTMLNPPGTDENYMEINQKSMESFLRKHPESIIEMIDECPTAKELVFNRLKKFGGVKWYLYLDMSNQVIRWVNENFEKLKMNKIEPKKCPFCGISMKIQLIDRYGTFKDTEYLNKPINGIRYIIYHPIPPKSDPHRCVLVGKVGPYKYNSFEEAAEMWNRRAGEQSE